MGDSMIRRILKTMRPLGLLEYSVGIAEWAAFGGATVERALLAALGLHYRSRFRRDNLWSREPPHFTNNSMVAFKAMLGGSPSAIHGLYRGFASAEVIRPQDVVLDIGCGDGFFTSRFFGPKAADVDGIDVEKSAIQRALRQNSGPNIRYHRSDATADPFPRSAYDVVVWDGALGHFSPETSAGMISKIRACLSVGGAFVGSESLGSGEGTDHLQFFETLADLDTLFAPQFSIRQYRIIEYAGGGGGLKAFRRREAYWRCGNDSRRLEDAGWHAAEWYADRVGNT